MFDEWLYLTALRLNRVTGRFRDVVWLVGDGRSGTTWAADLINHDGRYRQMFEPFHPKVTDLLSFEDSWPYVRPEDRGHPLDSFARAVFGGRLIHPRVDRYPGRLRYRGLLIKDIFAHLLLPWVDLRFPRVKKILLLRHPCAVAESKASVPDGRWMEDPRAFLLKEDLCERHLEPHRAWIEGAGTFFERQITIWCILHSVVFRQMDPSSLHVLFYEDLLDDFENSARRLFRFLGRPWEGSSADPDLSTRFAAPSETTRADSPIRRGRDPILAWRQAVSPEQEEKADEILRAFGLDGIYDPSGMPSRDTVERLLQSRAGDGRRPTLGGIEPSSLGAGHG